MMKDQPSYRIVPYPSSRRMTFDLGKVAHSRHYVHALLEVDITEAWNILRENRKSAGRVSVLAWLIKAVGDCVAEHKEVAAFNLVKRNAVAVFEDVDVSIVIEKEVNGTVVPLPYILRAVNSKTILQIHSEPEAARTQTVQGEGDYVLGQRNEASMMKAFLVMPQWLRVLLMKTALLGNPQRMKAGMGNVMVTTVGMVGHTQGWILPTTMHPLCLGFGSINEQPRVFKGEIAKRRVLHLAVIVDHDAVDGAPAARFIDALVVRLEKASGL